MRGKNKTGCEIIPFEDLVRRELDTDQIVDLIRRTPGIKPVEREMARLRLVDDLYDADIAAAEGIHYSRSSVTRHLAKVIPIIEYRYLRDKAGA
ncbi:MAG: hypothetical protein IJ466_11480 [Clostridia bacterium]|nr:hypothetical protein [Clostridia bacterium]